MVRALFLLRGRGLGYLTRKGNQTTQREKGENPSKRGRSLRNYPGQTQSSEFGQKEEGESHLGDDHGA